MVRPTASSQKYFQLKLESVDGKIEVKITTVTAECITWNIRVISWAKYVKWEHQYRTEET